MITARQAKSLVDEYNKFDLDELLENPAFQKMVEFVETTIQEAAENGNCGVFIKYEDIFNFSGMMHPVYPGADDKWMYPLVIFIRKYGFRAVLDNIISYDLDIQGISICW